MRARQIKGKEAILICGGKGFKIYSTQELDGWLCLIDKKLVEVKKGDKHFKGVTRYVNLRYEPLGQIEHVKDLFNTFLKENK